MVKVLLLAPEHGALKTARPDHDGQAAESVDLG